MEVGEAIHPLHADKARLFLLDVFPQRIGRLAVDVNLLHDGELDAVVCAIAAVSCPFLSCVCVYACALRAKLKNKSVSKGCLRSEGREVQF